ncbi:MAG: hypothetical protein U9R79_03400 [Armatimonadota bacterium]|nr:hypothetical protein [Armatimonadota bacterium]
MSRSAHAFILTIGGILMAAQPILAADADWRTQPPITYVLDYGSNHLGNPDYIPAVAQSPPTLLHLGKDVVMTHNWGPIQALGGENQAHGRGDDIRRLTPAETRERYEGLTEMVRGLHEAGVRWVCPYICSITLGGHHERRTGFWEFYDHWDEYRDEFDLPPRPELDPAEWMQRDPDGSMKSTYGVEPDEDEFYPPYEPNMRYAACVNNPGWRTWIDTVARLVAEVGYDGAFVDNSSTQRCYCRFCQAKFQDFLRAKYTDEQIRELFGADPGQVPLALQPQPDEPMTLGWVESRRFWRQSIHDHQQAIREAGLQASDHFILFPNGGHHRPASVKNSFQDSDYVMYELSVGDYGTHPGLVRSRIVEDIHLNVRNHHTWQLKYTAAVRERVSPLLLTRGGYPNIKPNQALNVPTAELGNAEAAAFGSGAGFLLRPRWDRYGSVLNTYRAFFEAHADLYEGLLPYAQVAVAAFGDQNLYEHQDHISSVQQITDELVNAHVLFDYVVEDRFTAEELGQYRTVIVPDVKYASPEQIAALESYMEGGGRAMIIGGTPTHDLQVRPLDAEALPDVMRPTDDDSPIRYQRQGQGSWLWISQVPLDRLGAAIAAPHDTLAAGYTSFEQFTAALSTAEYAERLSIAPGTGPGLRVNAFAAPDGSRLVLHVLNYDVELGGEPAPVQAKQNIDLHLPLPQGTEVASVIAFSPDRQEPASLGHRVEDGRALITLPSLRIYEVLQIELG